MIHTGACDVLGITHPVVQAAMASGYTDATLVAAVSEAGGMGTLGCLRRSAEEVVAEVKRIRERTDRPFAVNFVVPMLDEQVFSACLSEGVPIVSFFRGDPTAAVSRARAAGARTIFQVTTVEEARLGCAAGADVLIAQGMEAGGHMGPAALTTIVPAVARVAGGRPVLAAGGIVDGRGLAAALCLGAAGASMGTRFLLTTESPLKAAQKEALLQARPGDTVASHVPDIIWGKVWPGVQARALRNNLVARWLGREDVLQAERDQVARDVRQADETSEMVVLAGEGAGLIDAVLPAGEVVRQVVAEAREVLAEWGRRVEQSPIPS